MAFLGNDYSSESLPKNTNNFEPLPAGWYQASIAEASLAPTNDGTGQYIKIRYDITGPTHQGRVVFGNVNIKNKSAKAEEIGRGQLGDIIRAIGLAKITDTDQLIGADLLIKLNIRPESRNEITGKTYEASNEIRSWKSLSAEMPMAVKSETTATTKGKQSPPWSKK